MSRDALRELYDGKAFKPTPSLWELAETHVPFVDLGLDGAPERAIESGLREGDGFAALVGGSGCGKSSVLAHVAKELAHATAAGGRPYLPIFAPVAGRPEHASDLEMFGQGVILEVVLSLREGLDDYHREKLEAALGTEVAHQRAGSKFIAKLASVIPGAQAEAGFELASDVVSIVGKARLDGRGGLRTLGDIVRERGYELVVIVEDTDALAYGDHGLAAKFFTSVVRPLASEADIGVAIAVQTPWVEGESALGEATAALERAVASVPMPAVTSEAEARRVIRIVLDRRIENALGESSATALFSEDALAMLGFELRTSGSFRRPLAMIRDALDRRADDLPDRIERTDLLETL